MPYQLRPFQEGTGEEMGREEREMSVSVCVSMFFFSVCCYYCFFSDCRIYLFSSLAARVFNKLTRKERRKWEREHEWKETGGKDKGEREVYSPRYNNTAVKTDSIKTQSGGLPERHKAHLSWPPIVTKTITQNQLIYCNVQGAVCKGHKCAQISNASSYCC